MPESLRRIQPVHSHFLDRGAGDEARREKRPKKSAGDSGLPFAPDDARDGGIDTGAAEPSVNLLDVRI